jgi:hypothetical protein
MTKLSDNRVEIPLDFSDQELLVLFKQAHECDLTFNQFVEQALVKFLEQTKTEFLTKAVVEHIERQTNDTLLNQLDGSSDNEVVQRSWPYHG